MKAQNKKTLTGDHFTLAQVAAECIGLQTELEIVKEKKGTISDHFMDAAKVYIHKAPVKGEEMMEDHPFLVACTAQEAFSKSEAAGLAQWDKVPPAWSQMKSNIKAAFNMGLDINAYTTESALRKDLNEKRKEAKEDNKSPEEKAQEQLNGAIDVMITSGDVAITQRLFAIIEVCKDVSPEQSNDVARILTATLEDIKIMKALLPQAQEIEATRKTA